MSPTRKDGNGMEVKVKNGTERKDNKRKRQERNRK